MAGDILIGGEENNAAFQSTEAGRGCACVVVDSSDHAGSCHITL